MIPTGLRRREFLLRFGSAALSALGMAGATATAPGCARARDPLSEALSQFFEDPARAAAVGAAYLERVPEEANPQILVARIFGKDLSGAREQAAVDPAGLIAKLRAQHRDDFASGRTAPIAGWVLSLTEARLCAWAALEAG